MSEYRIEDLARESGSTVRNIRAYQDRGLLPKPGRRGRINVYDDTHLARLRQIAGLLDRGYTLASIKELLEAWDSGRGLSGVLGLLTEVDRPWSDETPGRLTRAGLAEAFGGVEDEEALAEAVALGVLEPDGEDAFLVPSPRLLSVAVELYAAGVPLAAVSGHLRALRRDVEKIAQRFLEFTTEHVFQRFLDHPPSETEAMEAAELVRRLRPLAQRSVDAELARAMRTLATRQLQQVLGTAINALPAPATAPAPAPAPASDSAHATDPAPAPRLPLDQLLSGQLLTVDFAPRAHGGTHATGQGEQAEQTVHVEVTIPEETADLLRMLLAHATPPKQ